MDDDRKALPASETDAEAHEGGPDPRSWGGEEAAAESPELPELPELPEAPTAPEASLEELEPVQAGALAASGAAEAAVAAADPSEPVEAAAPPSPGMPAPTPEFRAEPLPAESQPDSLPEGPEADFGPGEPGDLEEDGPQGVAEASAAGQAAEDHLEELILEPVADRAATTGEEALTWDGRTYRVRQALPRGWYRAEDEGGQTVLLREGPAALPADLPGHRLLPRPLYLGSEGSVYPWTEGEPWLPQEALSLEAAVERLKPLAQYAFALERQGYALLDLDPEGILTGESGPRLRFPPRVVRLGEERPRVYREGYTAPEASYGGPATGREGSYLLGALLYRLLTGEALPAEGPSPLRLRALGLPGLPQLMRAALAPDAERLTPTAFLAALRALVPQAQPRFAVGAATTVGLNPDRPVNEDAFGYSLRHLEAHEGSRLLLRACVADGMGGMAAGEVAARAAVEAFIGGAVPAPGDAGVQAEWAVDLVWQANRRVLEALAGEDGGCAFSGVVLVGSRVALAHVGDTRVYLRAAGGLRQLSRDHSLVAAMVASGMLTEEEAESSPDRNKILRSLGSVRQPQPDYVQGLSATQDEPTLELQPGEALVLLSDGVWGEVKPARLEQILAEHQQDPQAAADALVRAALEAGAPDNATAVIVQRER